MAGEDRVTRGLAAGIGENVLDAMQPDRPTLSKTGLLRRLVATETSHRQRL